jgi:hypothetical protein
MCSVCSQPRKRRLHDFGRLGVRIAEQVANRQRNRGRTVPRAPADGQNVDARGDQSRGMSVPQAVEGNAINFKRVHKHRKFLSEPMRRPYFTVIAREQQIIIAGAAELLATQETAWPRSFETACAEYRIKCHLDCDCGTKGTRAKLLSITGCGPAQGVGA